MAAHPDLSTIYSTSTSSAPSSSASKTTLPKNALDLLKFMRSHTSPQAVRVILIPVLERIANGEGQTGTSKKLKMKNGEKLLSLPGILKQFDMVKMDNREITSMTAALVYML